MAVQTKTLLNDLGSAVVAETALQLNRAAGYVSSPIGHTLVAGPNTFTICKFTEDVLITAIEFGFGSVAARPFDNAGDGLTIVTGATPNGLGGTTVMEAVDFDPAGAGAAFPTTDVWATMAALQAVANPVNNVGSDIAFQVAAGDSVALQIIVNAGSTVLGPAAQTLESVNVTYRPFKDTLNLTPDYPQVMRNFSSVPR